MAGSSRSASALATGISVAVGHVVAHGSMVTRAYLTDARAGIVVDGDAGPWLVSTRSALLPDPAGLALRAEQEKGIPREYGKPSLMKVTLAWGEQSSFEVRNPEVLAGDGGAAAIPLTFPASLPGKIRAADGPPMLTPVDQPPLRLGDAVGVAVLTSEGALVRWGRVASDPGFAGWVGAVALGVALAPDEAGSPVFRFEGEDAVFCGLADPIDATTALLVTTGAIAAVITDG